MTEEWRERDFVVFIDTLGVDTDAFTKEMNEKIAEADSEGYELHTVLPFMRPGGSSGNNVGVTRGIWLFFKRQQAPH